MPYAANPIDGVRTYFEDSGALVHLFSSTPVSRIHSRLRRRRASREHWAASSG